MRHNRKIQRRLFVETVGIDGEPHLPAIFHQRADIDAAIPADEEIRGLQRETIAAQPGFVAHGNVDRAPGIGSRVCAMAAAEAAHVRAQSQRLQRRGGFKKKREIAAMASAGELMLVHANKLAQKRKRGATRNRMAPPGKSRSCYSAAFLPFFASSSWCFWMVCIAAFMAAPMKRSLLSFAQLSAVSRAVFAPLITGVTWRCHSS